MFPNYTEEKRLIKKGYKYIVGIDEAGRGPLAGPVVAGAAIVDFKKADFKKLKDLKDSKKLSFKKREDFYKYFKNCGFVEWGIGVVSQKVIDRINIFEATKLAMKKAIGNLDNNPDFLILDGNFTIDYNCPSKSIIKGDERVISIAIASIFAKVHRDNLMMKMHKKYPEYGFDKHKGYGTKMHYEAIKKHGISVIHRTSFNLFF